MRPTTEAKTVEMFMQKTQLFGMGKVSRSPYTGAYYVRMLQVLRSSFHDSYSVHCLSFITSEIAPAKNCHFATFVWKYPHVGMPECPSHSCRTILRSRHARPTNDVFHVRRTIDCLLRQMQSLANSRELPFVSPHRPLYTVTIVYFYNILITLCFLAFCDLVSLVTSILGFVSCDIFCLHSTVVLPPGLMASVDL